jgi:hypothetical protein
VIIHERPGSQEVQAAAIASDGSIVVGGRDEGGASAMPFLARFDAEGNPDPTFGDNGWLLVDIPGVTNPDFQDLTFDEHGNILVAGSVNQGGSVNTAVFKFGNAGSGESRTWGDNNCSGSPDPVDSLLALRFDGGLDTNTGECPEMGQVVEVAAASPHPWGDIDCSGAANPVDSLKLLRFDAGLDIEQAAGCPEVGAEVLVSEPG